MVFERIKNRLLRGRESNEPKLETLTWGSLSAQLEQSNRPNLSVSVDYKCKKGGGGIIPVNSSNLDQNRDEVQEHLSHGDRMTVAFFGDNPIVHRGDLQRVSPKVQEKFKLVP